MSSILLYHIILILNLALAVVSQHQPTVVVVEQGTLQGRTERFEDDYLGVYKDIDVYQGVPYAEAPIDDLRFRAPVPKAAWGDDGEIYNATYPRDICMQYVFEAIFFTVGEDCLFLNIYVPNPKVSLLEYMNMASINP